MLRNAVGGGGGRDIRMRRKKCYKGLRFIINVTSMWVGVKFPEKACVTLTERHMKSL